MRERRKEDADEEDEEENDKRNEWEEEKVCEKVHVLVVCGEGCIGINVLSSIVESSENGIHLIHDLPGRGGICNAPVQGEDV